MTASRDSVFGDGVSGDGVSGDGVSGDGGVPPMDPKLEEALAAWSVPPARAEFKQRLREQFVHGAGLSVAPPVAHAPEPAQPARAQRRPRRAPTSTASSRRWGSLVGIAAVLAIVFGVRWLNPPVESEWVVYSTTGHVLDGDREVPLSDTSAVVELLLSGRVLRTTSDPLRIAHGDRYFLEVAPESTVSLTTVAAAVGPQLTLAPTAGAVHVATGSGFPARGMMVDTADVDILVTGTIFGIDVYDMGTCVCCMEGSLSLPEIVEDGEPCRVGADGAWFQWRDAERGGHHMDMPADHHEDLDTFAATVERLWGARK